MPVTADVSISILQPHQKEFLQGYVAERIEQCESLEAFEKWLKDYANRTNFIDEAFKQWRTNLLENIVNLNQQIKDRNIQDLEGRPVSVTPEEIISAIGNSNLPNSLYFECEKIILGAVEKAKEKIKKEPWIQNEIKKRTAKMNKAKTIATIGLPQKINILIGMVKDFQGARDEKPEIMLNNSEISDLLSTAIQETQFIAPEDLQTVNKGLTEFNITLILTKKPIVQEAQQEEEALILAGPPGGAPINPNPSPSAFISPPPIPEEGEPRPEQPPEAPEEDPEIREAIRRSQLPPDPDPNLTAALANSLAEQHQQQPSRRPPPPPPLPSIPEGNEQPEPQADDDMAAVLEESERLEKERQAKVQQRQQAEDAAMAESKRMAEEERRKQKDTRLPEPNIPSINIPPVDVIKEKELTPAQQAFETEHKRIQGEVSQYIENVENPSPGTFYGRSNQVSKLKIANKFLASLTNTRVFIIHSPDPKKLIPIVGEIQGYIEENRQATGNPIFHKPGTLAKLLEDTQNLIFNQLSPQDQLAAYIELAKSKKAETHMGFLGIKSDQKRKLDIANKLANASRPIKATDLTQAIEENRKATGPEWLHGPGRLEGILKAMLKEVDPNSPILSKKSKKPKS